MQLFEIITRNTRIHVMLRVPIHVPIEKLEHRVQRDRLHAFAKVSHILLQPKMLRQAKEIGQPIGDEIGQCENYRQNPKPGDKSLHNIMAGLNQTIMMSLAMVVIASMVTAPGLGVLVLRGIRNLELGVGLMAGVCIVLLAVMLDRTSKAALSRIDRTKSEL
jgi:hypothetical protein